MAPLWHATPDAVTVIRQVTPDITTFSVPFNRFGLIKFGGRATVTRLSTGALVVFSPIKMTPDMQTAIDGLGGNVSYLVAPDIEHHMQLGPWKTAFPSAKVIAMEGLREKRATQKNEDVPIDFEFSAGNKATLELPAEMKDEFDVEFVDGHANKEIVFNHKPSRTLIEADLVFNIVPNSEQYSKTGESSVSGFWTKVAMLFDTVGKGQQRFNWYAASKDKPSFNASINRINTWDFDRIIPCHGDVIETGGKGIFRQVFDWHITK